MSADPQYTVKTIEDRATVKEGEQLMVDGNLPVTFLGIESPPWGDDESGEFFPGRVRVRYSWGTVEPVQDTRAGVTVDEV